MSLNNVISDVPIKALVSQSLDHASFTDSESTSGYLDFTTGQLPACSLILGWKAVISEGFAGDTTAVITVGKSGATSNYTGDVDLSCLTDGTTVGSVSAEATAFEASAVTPRVTVTGASDFSGITAGTMVVTIYYLQLI